MIEYAQKYLVLKFGRWDVQTVESNGITYEKLERITIKGVKLPFCYKFTNCQDSEVKFREQITGFIICFIIVFAIIKILQIALLISR